MITDNEKFIEIQAILASSNINTRDCTKINDLIIELSKENQQEMNNVAIQQKEFIKWLEDGIDICDGFLDTVKSDLQEIPYGVISTNENITTQIKENETAHKVYEKILQKYKEIIGE